MQAALARLANVAPDKLSERVVESIRFEHNKNFIAEQEKLLDKQVESLSISLKLLQIIDAAASRETTESIRTEVMGHTVLLETILRLLADKSSPGTDIDKVKQEASEAVQSTREHATASVSTSISAQDDVRRPDQEQDTLVNSASQERLIRDETGSIKATRSTIIIAVKHELLEETKILLDSRDLNIFQADEEGWTVLHHAVANRSPDMLKLLLGRGSIEQPDFVNEKNNLYLTPLMLAAHFADYSEAYTMSEMLLQNGAKVNERDREEVEEGNDGANLKARTALHFAISDSPSDESERLASLLLECGADVRAVEKSNPQQVQQYACFEKFKTTSPDDQGGGILKRLPSLARKSTNG